MTAPKSPFTVCKYCSEHELRAEHGLDDFDTAQLQEASKAGLGTKWPTYFVLGKDVTPEQAGEILIRTDNLYLSGNDQEKKQAYMKILGKKGEERLNYQKICTLRESLGGLDLCYMTNDQILSSYIGGPNGWLDWSGVVVSTGLSIGKYPSVEDIFLDWRKIAATFPFLDLTFTLFDCGMLDLDEDLMEAQFDIKEGRVHVRVGRQMTPLDETAFMAALKKLNRLKKVYETDDYFREVGISEAELQTHVNRLRAKLKKA